MPTKTKSSAASRVRTRRANADPRVFLPPLPPLALLTASIEDVKLVAPGGATINLARAIASAPYELTMDGASSITLNVIDARDDLLAGPLLDLSENAILDEGILATLGGINWRLQAIQRDAGAPLAFTFVDDVAWAMSQDTSPLKASRGASTRAQFIYRMADQARKPPRRYFRIYIPELDDLQPIAKPTKDADGTAGGDPGFASDVTVRVKGVTASKAQRNGIAACLAEAHKKGASDRVLIAIVMCVTQESNGCDPKERSHGDTAGPDSLGDYQQRAPWGSRTDRLDHAKSTDLFLLGGKGGQPGWKQKHGSLRNASGDLGAMIQAVQNGPSASAYNQWETEAKATVKAWNPDSASESKEVAKRFEYTRGTSDGRESSWQSSGRLMQEINEGSTGDGSWHRWAVLNQFWYASDVELRQARPSLTVYDGAPWLVDRSFVWNANRPVTELTLTVLAAEWGLLPGAVVSIPTTWGPLAGRWLVRKVNGTVGYRQAEVTLHRPVAKRAEPPHEVSSSSSSGSGSAAALKREASKISGEDHPYRFGGGHGKPLASIGQHEGLDCSSSTSLALRRAGMFPGTQAIVSGDFAQWGKPGKGDDFTVWYSATHVFIEGYDSSGSFKWRFDTSPHGSGPSGPHVRTKARSTAGFSPRHWAG